MKEKQYPLCDAVERATGYRPHLSTAIRWSTRGCGGVVLETNLVGGKRMASVEAVDRFVIARTTAGNQRAPSPLVTPKQREKQIDAAEKTLKQFGVSPQQSIDDQQGHSEDDS